MKRILTTLSHKWPEYFLEILVLIIGIYGAFAVDNWNDAKKQELEEIELLRNIKVDLLKASDELDALNEIRIRILSATNEFYKAIRNEITYTDDDLDSLFSSMKITPTFNSPTGTINALFNTGKIITISNDSIREELLTWPQAVEDMIEEELYANDYLRLSILSIARKYIPFTEVNKFFKFQSFAGGLEIGGISQASRSKFPHDYQGLFNDIEFEGSLSNRELMIYMGIVQSESLKNKAQNIIELIDKEIGK